MERIYFKKPCLKVSYAILQSTIPASNYTLGLLTRYKVFVQTDLYKYQRSNSVIICKRNANLISTLSENFPVSIEF